MSPNGRFGFFTADILEMYQIDLTHASVRVNVVSGLDDDLHRGRPDHERNR